MHGFGSAMKSPMAALRRGFSGKKGGGGPAVKKHGVVKSDSMNKSSPKSPSSNGGPTVLSPGSSAGGSSHSSPKSAGGASPSAAVAVDPAPSKDTSNPLKLWRKNK